MNLFNKLDAYIDNVEEEKVKSCCDIEENVEYTGEWFVCVECGKILSTMKEEATFKENTSFILKTFILL
jgi:hypothetical protein